MKNLLLKTITLCALMIPLARSEAATPGGLKPGTSFKLTVTTRSSTKTGTSGTDTHARVPSGIPNFKKGQQVKFTVGANGQLKADAMSIPIFFTEPLRNTYISKLKTNSSTTISTGVLTKRKKLLPEALHLSFSRTSVSALQWEVQNVSYDLK